MKKVMLKQADLPLTAVDQPLVLKTSGWARWFLVYTWVAVILLPLLLLNFASSALSGSGRKTDVKMAGDGAAVAWAAAKGWVDDPDGGSWLVLGAWLGSRSERLTVRGDGGSRLVNVERHSFAATPHGGATDPFVVDVSVVRDEESGAIGVISPPSLRAVPRPGVPVEVPVASLWGVGSVGAADENLEKGVQRWAAALFSGDPIALRQTTGDPDTGAVYLPFTGWELSEVAVGEVAIRPGGEAFVRVSIFASAAGVRSRFTYDVLVLDANTGSPRVVAWGPPGSAASLRVHGNRIDFPPVPVTAPTTTAAG